MSRTVRRLLVVVGLLLAALVAAQSPASAHARLVSSSPADGAVTATAPAQVVLRFDEEVDAALSSVKLAAPGRPARALDVTSGGASTSLRAALPAGAGGPQIVLWRAVTTDDGHAEEGRLSFTIAAGTAVAGNRQPAATPVDVGSGAVSSAVYGIARWLALIGFCVLVGTAFFNAACAYGAFSPGRRRAMRTGWLLLATSSVVGLLTYGAAVSGRPLGNAFHGSVLYAGATSRVGQLLAVRLLLIVLAARVVWSPRAVGGVYVGAWAVGTAATWSLAGHSRSGGDALLMVPIDLAHLVAAAVWLGGLVAVLVSGADLHARSVRRFSTVAVTCVLVLVTTGTVQTWRRVGSPAALEDNRYGQLLILKVVLVALTLVAAAWVRRRLRRSGGAAVAPRLRRGMLWETALGATVLAVTSALVVTLPAREGHAHVVAANEASSIRPVDTSQPVTATTPFDTGRPGGRGQLALEVVPEEGGTTVHLAVLDGGGQPRAARVVVALRRGGSTGTGMAVPMQQIATGHFKTAGAVATGAGEWELGVGVLLPDGGRASTTAAFNVR